METIHDCWVCGLEFESPEAEVKHTLSAHPEEVNAQHHEEHGHDLNSPECIEQRRKEK